MSRKFQARSWITVMNPEVDSLRRLVLHQAEQRIAPALKMAHGVSLTK